MQREGIYRIENTIFQSVDMTPGCCSETWYTLRVCSCLVVRSLLFLEIMHSHLQLEMVIIQNIVVSMLL